MRPREIKRETMINGWIVFAMLDVCHLQYGKGHTQSAECEAQVQ